VASPGRGGGVGDLFKAIMIHPFIITLNSQFTYNQWLFLLTCYELSKGQWICRRDVYRAAGLPEKSTSNTSHLMKQLRELRMLREEKRENKVNGGTWFIKLTKEARDILEGAFKAVAA
jgi:hypothetical protein